MITSSELGTVSGRAKEYETEIRYEFDRDDRAVRYIRFGMDQENGKVVRCMIQYEVDYGGETYALARFDTADEGYHRHEVGIPTPPSGAHLPAGRS